MTGIMIQSIRRCFEFFMVICFVLISFSSPCISFGQTDSSDTVLSDPRIAPFLFNAEKVTRNMDSPKKQWARFCLHFKNVSHIGQKLFPRIDSAAKAVGWIESDLKKIGTFVESATYWKIWNNESGITGEYNITFHLLNGNGVIVEWRSTPSDYLTTNLQNLHDSRLDDPIHKDTKRVWELHFIAINFSYIPPGHHLYPLLLREFEYLLLKDSYAVIRAHVPEYLRGWDMEPKRSKALSLLNQSIDDPSPLVRFRSAKAIIKLGDSLHAKTSSILIEFATGKVLNKMDAKKLLDAGIDYRGFADQNGKISKSEVRKRIKTLRMEAVTTLVDCRTAEAKQALERLKTDRVPEIRFIAQQKNRRK